MEKNRKDKIVQTVIIALLVAYNVGRVEQIKNQKPTIVIQPTPVTVTAADCCQVCPVHHKAISQAPRTEMTQSNSGETEQRFTILPVKEDQKGEALKIAQTLREAGISAKFEVMGRKMAKALEDADKRKEVDYAIIVGERELKEGKVIIKNLANRTQAEVKIEDLSQKIQS